jgi:hypothetical protein
MQRTAVNNPYMPISSYISSERISYLFIVFVGLFTILFNLSFIDLLFFHTDMGCKNLIYKPTSISLNTWLQISSVYGLIYTILFFTCFCIAIECREQTPYIVMYEKFVKIAFLVSTLFMFLWNVLGLIMFGVNIDKCNVPMFNTYMWSRLSLGCAIQIVFTASIILKMKFSDTPSIRNWFYIIQTTYNPPSN